MRIIYLILCKVYGLIITFYEKKFLFQKNLQSQYNINLKGYELIKNTIDLQIIENEKEIKVNKYNSKKIIKKESLNKFLNHLFLERKLADKITERTNYNYSIDFFTSYQNLHIPIQDANGDWYANKWHNDKPFSDNTLKIIIPLNDMSSGNFGGIQILSLNDSKKFQKEETNKFNFFEMKTSLDEFLIFFPKLCYHRAGNPSENLKRNQIMLQLNPSKYWSINSNIYQKQFYLEPKFPLFNYMFEKKNLLKKS